MAINRLTAAIVEDDDLIAMALASMLQEVGVTVVAAAHTYEDALALFEHGLQCDVIFVDLLLHGIPTGVDVARRAGRQGIAVIITTGGSSVPDELAGVGLLLKPFSMEQVRALLHGIRAAPRA